MNDIITGKWHHELLKSVFVFTQIHQQETTHGSIEGRATFHFTDVHIWAKEWKVLMLLNKKNVLQQ